MTAAQLATYFPEPGSVTPPGGFRSQGSAGHSPAAGPASGPLTPGDSVGKPVSPGGKFNRAALPGLGWTGGCRAGGTPTCATAPRAARQHCGVMTGKSNHPLGEWSLGSASGHNHTKNSKCKTVGSKGLPMACFTPPGPLRPAGPPQGDQMGYLYLGSGHRVQENQHRHQGPCQDAVLDLPEAEQECHAEGQQVQPWKRRSS